MPIQFSNGNQIVHLYDAMGNRLRTTYYTRKVALVEPATNTIPGTDNLQEYNIASYTMLGSRRYIRYNHYDLTLDMIMNSEGFMKYFTPEERYPYYYIKDHLGNVREAWIRPYPDEKYLEQRMQYYPSGLPWNENVLPGNQPFKYGGKEFIEMHGLDEYDSKARWYYPAIMRTTTMDPMCEKYYSMSPYAWCGNNSVNYVDPDGRATFYNNGDSIGTDGVNDGRIYLLKTEKTQYGDEKIELVPGAGLSKDERRKTIRFIKENSGNSEAFEKNPLAYNNCIEIPLSESIRDEMIRIVSEDNGWGGDSPKNNREYGGSIKKSVVSEASPGPVIDPSIIGNVATISLPENAVTFHSHQSGTRTINGVKYGVVQSPSSLDINSAGTFVHYVFGMGDRIVYIYTSAGVQAEIPLRRFKKLH